MILLDQQMASDSDSCGDRADLVEGLGCSLTLHCFTEASCLLEFPFILNHER